MEAVVFLLSCLLVFQAGQETVSAQESCEGLDNINNAQTLTCTRDSACLTLNCNLTSVLFSGYQVLILLLPCNEPPAVRIVASTQGMEVLNNTFSTSMTQGVTLAPDTELEITVQFEGRTATISAQVTMPGSPIPILMPTPVTLPPCSGGTTPSPIPTTPAAPQPTSTPSPSPSPTPPSTTVTPTCASLRELAANPADPSFECSTNDGLDCDQLECSALVQGIVPVDTVVTVLPCNNPPGIRLNVTTSLSGTEIKVLDKSQMVEVFGGAMLNVTIDQLKDGIGVEMSLMALGMTTPLVHYTVIPIDRSQCVDNVGGSAEGVHRSGMTVLLTVILLALLI